MLFKLSAELDTIAYSFLYNSFIFWLQRQILLYFFYITSSIFISFTGLVLSDLQIL